MRHLTSITLALIALSLAACTTEQVSRQAYEASSGWKVEVCRKKIDPVERERCLDESRTSYKDFKQQQQDAHDDKLIARP